MKKTLLPRKRGRPVNTEQVARRKAEILRVAASLFAQHGYAGADTQLLADKLQVGKGTIYRYYPSKAKLFHAVLDHGMNRLREQVERDTASIADPLLRIQQAITSFLLHFEGDPHLAELFVQELACFRQGRKPAFFTHHDLHIGPWRELFRGLIAQGRVRDIPIGTKHDVVNDLLYGTIIANHALGRREPGKRGSARQQAEHIIDIIFHGILSDAERKKTNSQRRRVIPQHPAQARKQTRKQA